MAAGFGRHGMPPPASNDTGTAFCFRIKKRQRWDIQTMWASDLDLWPWNWCAISTCRGVSSCQFWWYYDASTECQWAGRDVIAIDRSARAYSSNSCCLDGRNWQITFFGDKILDLESDFRKLGSVTMLWSLIRILRASLVQIDTEMAEKYAKRYPTTTTSSMR